MTPTRLRTFRDVCLDRLFVACGDQSRCFGSSDQRLVAEPLTEDVTVAKKKKKAAKKKKGK